MAHMVSGHPHGRGSASGEVPRTRWCHLVPRDTIAFMAMTLRLDDELDAALEETARREHRSKQDVVRVAIQQYTSRRSRLRDEALARIVTEDAELLRRLGE